MINPNDKKNPALMIAKVGIMAALSYPSAEHADLLNDAKLGILCGTIASALVGCLMLNKFLPAAPSPQPSQNA